MRPRPTLLRIVNDGARNVPPASRSRCRRRVWREYFGYRRRAGFSAARRDRADRADRASSSRARSPGRASALPPDALGFSAAASSRTPRAFRCSSTRAPKACSEKPSFRRSFHAAALPRSPPTAITSARGPKRPTGLSRTEPPTARRWGSPALHETYLDANGSEIDTACIVTTSANAALAELSARMPVIVPRAAFCRAGSTTRRPARCGARAAARPRPTAFAGEACLVRDNDVFVSSVS